MQWTHLELFQNLIRWDIPFGVVINTLIVGIKISVFLQNTFFVCLQKLKLVFTRESWYIRGILDPEKIGVDTTLTTLTYSTSNKKVMRYYRPSTAAILFWSMQNFPQGCQSDSGSRHVMPPESTIKHRPYDKTLFFGNLLD